MGHMKCTPSSTTAGVRRHQAGARAVLVGGVGRDERLRRLDRVEAVAAAHRLCKTQVRRKLNGADSRVATGTRVLCFLRLAHGELSHCNDQPAVAPD